MRFRINEITPSRFLEALKRRVDDISAAIEWKTSRLSQLNKDRLEHYRDLHKGERCFILANGPSLAGSGVSRLSGETTICMNRAYLMFEQWGFKPTYYIGVNELVLEQFARDIADLSMPKFLNWNRRSIFQSGNDDTLFLRVGLSLTDYFQADLTGTICSGGTVTFAALQMAYYMGFQEVVILGMDHSFVEKGRPNKTELRLCDKDESHCHPDYFPKGIKWQLPDLLRSEQAYLLARQKFEQHGRRVLDATIEGKCPVFEKEALDALI